MKAAILNDTSDERHVGSTTVVKTLINLLKAKGITISHRFSRAEVKDKGEWVKSQIRNANLVIINGEGSLHRGNLFLKHTMNALPPVVPTVIINSVWEKMFVCERVLKRFEFIAVRESLSAEALSKVYPNDKILTVPDLLFYQDGLSNGIGYGDTVIDTLRDELDEQRNYFPMQFSNEAPDVVAYCAWLRGIKLYVTGRFHGVCLAAITKTPFLAFPSNSHKIEGLLKDMGCSDLLINSLDEVAAKRPIAESKRETIGQYVTGAKGKIDGLVERLSGLVNKK